MEDLIFEIVHPSTTEYVDHIFCGDTQVALKHPTQTLLCANLTIRRLPSKDCYAVTVGDTRRRLLNIKSSKFTLSDLRRHTRDLKELSKVLLPGGNLRLREPKSNSELPLYISTIYRSKLPIDTPANVVQTSLLMGIRCNQNFKNSKSVGLRKPLYLDTPVPLEYLEYKNGCLLNSKYRFVVGDLGFHVEESLCGVTFGGGDPEKPIVITKDLNLREIDGNTIWELVYERINADLNHRLQFVLNRDTNEAWEALSGHVIGVPNKLTWGEVFATFLENHRV